MEFINGSQVPTGGAILDDRVVFFIPKRTAHHQKVLVVNGERGLIAFCGGVDINPDRIDPIEHSPGSPYHDVQCRIRGPGAGDLLQVFIERWTDHPAVASLPPARQGLRGIGLPAPKPVPWAPAAVQIGRTYASGASIGQVPATIIAEMQKTYDQLQKQLPLFLPVGQVDPGDLSDGYTFAPFGSVQVAPMLIRAISAARHFIYVEDQFFVDTAPNDAGLSVVDALVNALPRLDNLTVLVTHPDNLILPQKGYRRRLLIDTLRAAGGRKVRVFQLTPPCAPHSYVHSKTWIFDDQFAIIGSANFNRRSWTNDSEAVAGIYDPSSWFGPGVPRRLRMRLWAEHLNVPRRFLRNGVASARLWLNPPPGAKVAPYHPSTLDDEPLHPDREWFLVDPDGSGDGLGPFASP